MSHKHYSSDSEFWEKIVWQSIFEEAIARRLSRVWNQSRCRSILRIFNTIIKSNSLFHEINLSYNWSSPSLWLMNDFSEWHTRIFSLVTVIQSLFHTFINNYPSAWSGQLIAILLLFFARNAQEKIQPNLYVWFTNTLLFHLVQENGLKRSQSNGPDCFNIN